jgi:hypothetical protein
MGGARRAAILGALALLAFGCADGTLPLTGVAVTPTAPSFSVDGWAVYRVSNVSHETIRLARCGDHVQAGLDRRVNDEWQNEMAAVCILSFYTPPLELGPGQSVVDSVPVRTAGVYRVVVGYGQGNLDVLRTVRSGGFRVE